MPIMQGKARYVKILGKPVDGYDKTEADKQWEFELVIDKETEAKLLPGFNVKSDEKSGDRFVKFSRKAYKKDGEMAKQIAVADHKGADWDRSVMIGNGSTLNVLFENKEWEFGRKSGHRNSVIKVQVWEHIPYEGKDQFPTRADSGEPIGEVWE